MKKIAVVFPGVGYTCGKPLLYYTSGVAKDRGYEVLCLDYGQDIHASRGRSWEELSKVTELAVQRAREQLDGICWEAYGDILFISKSIGTVLACRVQEIYELEAYQFMITPVPAALACLGTVRGCFFSGTDDPYIGAELAEQAVQKYPDKAGKIFPGCNHSLEKPGDTLKGLENLKTVVSALAELLRVKIRRALPEEAGQIAEIEAVCFPAAEASGAEEIRKRLETFPENFFVAEEAGKLVGFINGCTTDAPVLGDALYHDAGLHKMEGEIQTVFGLDVLPEYRHRGIARRLLGTLCTISRERGKKAVILTCKERLIPFYESCGFHNRGKAESGHGGAVWYDMQQWF